MESVVSYFQRLFPMDPDVRQLLRLYNVQISSEFFFLDIPFFCRLFQLLDEVECVSGLRVGRHGRVDTVNLSTK